MPINLEAADLTMEDLKRLGFKEFKNGGLKTLEKEEFQERMLRVFERILEHLEKDDFRPDLVDTWKEEKKS